MKKRLISLALCLVMVLSLFPLSGFAAAGDAPACNCKSACTDGKLNAACPVCGAKDAKAAACALNSKAASKDGASKEAAPTDGAPTDAAPKDGAPTDAAPKDGTPTDGTPTDGAPTDGAPTDGTPTDGTPTDGTPTDAAPTDGAPTDGTPTDGAPTDGAPTDTADDADEADKAAAARVQGLIDALPEVEALQAMTADELRAADAEAQAAVDEYEALTPGQQELVDTAALEAVLEYLAGQVAPAAGNTAKYNGTEYATLQAALGAALADDNAAPAIELIAENPGNATISATAKSISIDLKGYASELSLTVTGGTLTLTNNQGELPTDCSNAISTLTVNGGNVTLGANVVVTSLNAAGGAVTILSSANSVKYVTVSGGAKANINSPSDHTRSAACTYNSITVNGGTATISSGEGGNAFSLGETDMVSLSVTGGELNVSGGTFGNVSMNVTGGKMNISGGTFNNSISVTGGELNVSGGTLNGNLYADNCIAVSSGTTNVSGGTFSKSIGIGGGTLNVTGGTVNKIDITGGGTLTVGAKTDAAPVVLPDIGSINVSSECSLSFKDSFVNNGGVVDTLTSTTGKILSSGAFRYVKAVADRFSSLTSVAELLTDNAAFYTGSGESSAICKAEGASLSSSTGAEVYYVRAHECDFKNSGTPGICACGRVCPHDSVTDAGQCSTCGQSFTVKATNSKDPSASPEYYTQLPSKLKHGWTYTLIADASCGSTISLLSGGGLKDNSATIALNGHNLSGSATFGADGTATGTLTIQGAGSMPMSFTVQSGYDLILKDFNSDLNGRSITVNGDLSFDNVTADLSSTTFVQGGSVVSGSIDFSGLENSQNKTIGMLKITKSPPKIKLTNGLVFNSFSYTPESGSTVASLLQYSSNLRLEDKDRNPISADTELNNIGSLAPISVVACTHSAPKEGKTTCPYCGHKLLAKLTYGTSTEEYYPLVSDAVRAAEAVSVASTVTLLHNTDTNPYDNFTVSGGNITLDLGGKILYGRITVADGVSFHMKNGTIFAITSGNLTRPVSDFLCAGYGYKQGTGDNPPWVADASVNTLDGWVEIWPVPIGAVEGSISPGNEFDYGANLEMRITAVKDGEGKAVAGTPSYAWYTVANDNVETPVSGANAATLTINKPDAGTYNYRCKVTLDGFTVSHDFLVTVNKATIDPTDITAPEAKQGLTFTPKLVDGFYVGGESQFVVEEGTVPAKYDGVKIMYSVGDDAETRTYTAAPNDEASGGLTIGDATVGEGVNPRKIYWYVDGGNNYESLYKDNPQKLPVNIAQFKLSGVEKDLSSWTPGKAYDGTAAVAQGYIDALIENGLTVTYDEPDGSGGTTKKSFTLPYADVDIAYSASAEYASADAGTNKAVTVTWGLNEKNFVFASSPVTSAAKGEITKATLTSISLPAALTDAPEYDAQKNTLTLTYGDSGLDIAPDIAPEGATPKLLYTVDPADVAAVDASGKLSIKNAGTATVTIAVDDNNYNALRTSFTLKVNPAELTVRAINKSAWVGETLPSLTKLTPGTDYTVSGLVGDETVTVALEYYDAAGTAPVKPDMTKPGTYKLRPVVSFAAGDAAGIALFSAAPTAKAGNYTLKPEDGEFEVKAKPVITASAAANGRISPSGSVTVAPGASQTFTITPNSGYVVASVKVDGVNRGSIKTYTFTNVMEDHTISVTFMRPTANPQTGVDVG